MELRKPSMPAEVPVTLEAAAAAGPDWRDGFAWPVAMPQTVVDLRAAADGYWQAVIDLDDAELRDIALTARRPTLVYGLVQLARLVAAARETGMRLTGPREIEVLEGTIPADPGGEDLREMTVPRAATPLRGVRRVARTASWTPWWRLARSLLAPEAIAMQHNSLLRAELRRARVAAALRYPDDLLGDAASPDPIGTPTADTAALGRQIARRMVGGLTLPEDIRERLADLIARALCEAAREGALRIERLRARRTLPARLHLGNGIRSVLRPIALEVLRRGGTVAIYDHGSTYPLTGEAAMLAQNEMAIASTMVLASHDAAAMPTIQQAGDMVRAIRPLEIAGGAGDPALRTPPAGVRSTVSVARRQVMYVSSAYYGAQQLFPPLLPAPLYWDWQLRLFELLQRMPVDVMAKPHPEGVEVPTAFPWPAGVRRVVGRFESVLDQADVIVFDCITTTTFAVAVCTNRPVVLLDLGLALLNPVAAAIVHRRCRIVPASYDDRNRPAVDAAAFEEAVCGGPDVSDPAEFRALYLGEMA